MNKQVLNAEERKITGRKVKTLRAAGLIPANIFGKKIDSKAVQVKRHEFEEVYKEAGETGLIELTLSSEKRPVLVHDIQLNPKTDEVLHVDFLQVDLKEKVEAEVPVELTGESPAEKQSIGTVVQYVNEVKVEALPTDLPEKFEVDTTELTEVDQAVYIKDIKIDRTKVEIKNDPEEIVVKVEPPQKIVEEAPPVPAEGEVPAEGAAAEGTPEGESAQGGETPKEEAKE